MFGLFARSRFLSIMIAVAFLVAAVALGVLYIWSPHATLRITSGVEGVASPALHLGLRQGRREAASAHPVRDRAGRQPDRERQGAGTGQGGHRDHPQRRAAPGQWRDVW